MPNNNTTTESVNNDSLNVVTDEAALAFIDKKLKNGVLRVDTVDEKFMEELQGYLPVFSIVHENWEDSIQYTVITRQVTTEEGKKNLPVCVLLHPLPALEAIMDNAQGKIWLEKHAHAAIRQNLTRAFRSVTLVSEAQELTEIADYPDVDSLLASQRSGGQNTEAWDAFYGPVREAILQANPPLRGRLPSKADFLKCVRSASYATNSVYAKLEELKLFTAFANAVKNEAIVHNKAVAEGDEDAETFSDEAIVQIDTWLENRDSLQLTAPATLDDVEITTINFGG